MYKYIDRYNILKCSMVKWYMDIKVSYTRILGFVYPAQIPQ